MPSAAIEDDVVDYGFDEVEDEAPYEDKVKKVEQEQDEERKETKEKVANQEVSNHNILNKNLNGNNAITNDRGNLTGMATVPRMELVLPPRPTSTIIMYNQHVRPRFAQVYTPQNAKHDTRRLSHRDHQRHSHPYPHYDRVHRYNSHYHPQQLRQQRQIQPQEQRHQFSSQLYHHHEQHHHLHQDQHRQRQPLGNDSGQQSHLNNHSHQILHDLRYPSNTHMCSQQHDPPRPSNRSSNFKLWRTPTTRYFLMKSNNVDNIAVSMKKGVWSTQEGNAGKLNAVFNLGDPVVLVFSVNESRQFQGFAVMTSIVGDGPACDWNSRTRLSPNFSVEWICRNSASFMLSAHLHNPLNENKPVKIGRDGQEIERHVGQELCDLILSREL